MQEFYPILQECPLFEGIRVENYAGILSCMGTRLIRVKKEEILFREGDNTVFIGIVLTGAVRLIREDFYGNRSIVGLIGPKELFGESYAFSEAKTLPVTVQADVDSQCLLIDSRRIAACCSNACDFHNRLIANLLRLVATKNLMLHQKIQVTSGRTTRDKLMLYLLSQAKLKNSNTFAIPYDRQELADYLEVDRSGLSAEISKLRKEGVLECEKSTFKLL